VFILAHSKKLQPKNCIQFQIHISLSYVLVWLHLQSSDAELKSSFTSCSAYPKYYKH